MSTLTIALRSLRKTPGFTAAAVLTLGLGIGANTAIFSVVDGVLLRPAPFPDVERLAMVWETDRKSGTTREPASVPDWFDFQQRSVRFQTVAAFGASEATVTPAGGDAARVATLFVSHEFLPTVGIRPLRGRTFTADEDRPGAAPVALIGEDLWERLFARDPGAVGRDIVVNERPVTVVGILPRAADFGTLQILSAAAYGRGFADRGDRVRVDLWLSLRPNPETNPRSNHPIFLLGRLRPGATASQAQQEMTAIAADLEATYPDDNDARGVHVEALGDVVFGPVRPALRLLMGAVALVLLVACANVAHLLLARGTARQSEITVRAALGAGTGRLVRQFLVEGAVLAVAAGIVGLVLAVWGLDLLRALAPADVPRIAEVGIDARVLGITLGTSALVALACGLLPAYQLLGRGLHTSLRGAAATMGHRRFRSALVVTELAFAVMLMAGAGLLIKSLWRLQRVDPGFETDGVLKAQYQLPASRYPRDFAVWPDWPEIRRFNDDVRRRVAALPGVQSVAVTAVHPLDAGYTSSINVVGREAEGADWPEPAIRMVDAGYFATVSLAVLEGRPLEAADDHTAPRVVLINEAARARFFGERPPLGQRIALWGSERTIVGVTRDERIHGLAAATPPALYLPLAQVPSAGGGHSILIRTSIAPTSLAAPLRAAVRDLDPALPLFGVEPLAATLSQTLGQRRFTMIVLGTFAGVALLLAVVGVHGVLSYAVARRRPEIGIRMALGADRRSISALVLSEGARLAAWGVGLGVLGAVAVTRALTALLYGVHPNDPLTLGLVALGLGGTALLASWLPARRAASVDPMVALRYQ
jgi:predicted permease